MSTRSGKSSSGSVSRNKIKPETRSPHTSIPLMMMERCKEDMEKMEENPDDYTNSDRSEMIERLGIVQFYFGKYHDAINTISLALKARNDKKYSRNKARMQVLSGIAKYRTGDLSGAETDFKDVISGAVKSFPDIAVTAYANMSCVQYALDSIKGAVDNAKKGLELAVKCAKGDKTAQIVLQVARILVSVYLRINEFSKAEAILYTFKFPKSELVLLQAGTKFAQGNLVDATSLVELHLEERAEAKKKEQEKQEREKKEAEDKAREMEMKRIAREEEERRLKEEEEQKAKAKEEALARGEVEEESEDDSFLSLSDEEEGTVSENDDSTATGAAKEDGGKKGAEDDARASEADCDMGGRVLRDQEEANYLEDTKRRLALDDLLIEARLVYNLSVMSSREYRFEDSLRSIERAEQILEEYTRERTVREKLRRKNEQLKWKKALIAARKSVDVSIEDGLNGGSLVSEFGRESDVDRPESIDGSLNEGQPDWLSEGYAEDSVNDLDHAKALDEGEYQRLLDMPLDTFPVVETMDASAEPMVVLSHILQAKAEIQLQRSRGLVEAGLDASYGNITNRGLVFHPDLPPEIDPSQGESEEKNESAPLIGERRLSHASSITEGGPHSLVGGAADAGLVPDSTSGKWMRMDQSFQEARRLFEKSISVLRASRLKNSIYETVDRHKKEVVDVPGYTDEATGEEVPPIMRTETVETPVSVLPYDISLSESAYATYSDRMKISVEGIPFLKKVSSSAISALKGQYGINLNPTRGTKAHQKERVDAREYVPTTHDINTLKAEIMPLVNSSGRDEVALWIEWALTSSQGLGMGLLGLNFNMPISRADALKQKAAEAARAEKLAAESASLASGSIMTGDEVSMDTMAQGSIFKNLGPGSTIGNKDAYPMVKPSARVNESFLKEVRGRLSEVEALLSTKYDGNESKYKPGTKELRLLVNGVLARINIQVKNKRDAELAVDLMEELAQSMTQRTQNHDPLYISLAARFRLELEECKIPAGQSNEAQNKSMCELLKFAKAYVASVEEISDCKDGLVIKRDAYKKCINYYNSLAIAPLADKEKPVTEVGTLDMLLCYSDAEVDEKEDNGDLTFLRTFGKVRAKQLIKKMAALR